MAYQHKHMMVAHRCHTGGWRGFWKFPLPVGGQIQIAENSAERPVADIRDLSAQKKKDRLAAASLKSDQLFWIE
jgi:hypothetical protein